MYYLSANYQLIYKGVQELRCNNWVLLLLYLHKLYSILQRQRLPQRFTIDFKKWLVENLSIQISLFTPY